MSATIESTKVQLDSGTIFSDRRKSRGGDRFMSQNERRRSIFTEDQNWYLRVRVVAESSR